MSQRSIPIWRGAGRTPFVGRTAELAALRARLAAAGQGEGGVVLIAGEPGIGKTRLAGELAEQAQADGWIVLAGRAYQAEGLPPYLPFVEALRAYVRAAVPETLRRQLGQGARDVALLVRDVRTVLPEIPPAEPSDAEIDRYTLFESIADLLIAIAQEGSRFQVPGSTPHSASPETWNLELRPPASCWSWTTFTGPTCRRCSCCCTCHGGLGRGRSCWPAPTAMWRSTAATRSARCWRNWCGRR